MPNIPTETVPLSPRLAPGEQGLTTSTSPITAPIAVNSQLGNLVDQAVAGSSGANAQLMAIMSDPNARQALIGGEERPVRGAPNASRVERNQEPEVPSIEQIQALEAASRQAAQLSPQQIAQLTGAPATQMPAIAPVPPFQMPAEMPAAPAQAPAPAPANQPEWMAPFRAVTEAMAAQSALITQLVEAQQAAAMPSPAPEPELTEEQRLTGAANALMAAGMPRERITPEMAINYLNFQENRALQARIAQLEAQENDRWRGLSQQAQAVRTEQAVSQGLSAALAPYGARATEAVKNFVGTNVWAQVRSGVPVEQAIAQASQVLAQMMPVQQPPAPAAPMFTPPVPQHMQVPAYQNLSPLQVQQQQQAMIAAAAAGNGAGRYKPSSGPSLESLDHLFMQLGN